MANHNELGKKGEQIAHDYLIEKGYTICEKNYRVKHLEVDIIAKKEDVLVVVEVKTRRSTFMSNPEMTVKKMKQVALINVANDYVQKEKIDLEIRFDVISILSNKETQVIHHLKDAFYPTL